MPLMRVAAMKKLLVSVFLIVAPLALLAQTPVKAGHKTKHLSKSRIEAHQAGAVWLQLPNKSMLMNQKIGQRLADACVNSEQALAAERLIKNPPPVSYTHLTL